MNGVLEISTRPGLISAVAFILFDIFLLTLFDKSLSCSLSSLYYRRMFRYGDALRVRSADLPCVTNFLVGSRLALMNIAVILLKLGILAAMLYVDIAINSRVKTEESGIVLKSTYNFNLSDAEWATTQSSDIFTGQVTQQEQLIRVVERRWAEVRECREAGEAQGNSYNITFYRVGYNLIGDIALDDEKRPKGSEIIPVNSSTVTCLRPGVVRQPVVAAVVRGCSDFRDGTCPAVVPKNVTVNLSFSTESTIGIHRVPEGTTETTFDLFEFEPDDWKETFPFYAENNATLTCSRTRFSAPGSISTGETRGDKSTSRLITTCLFVVWANQTTLFEKWQYDPDSSTLVRDFPGPVFEGTIDIGMFQRANLLFNLFREANWLTLATIVVAEGAIYSRLNSTNVTRLGRSYTITIVSYTALIVTAILLVAVIVLRLATAFALAGDERPQLNSIDGLSSIAREEAVPSGRSVIRGHTSYLGLTLSNDGALRFGPLVDPGLAVRPIKGVDII